MTRLDRFLSRWISALAAYQTWTARRASWILLATLLVTAGSGYVIATRAGIDTRTSNLLSKDLRFHVLNRRFEQLFPQQHNAIVLVLHGPTRHAVDRAARRILVWLRQHPHEYQDPLDPEVDPFFHRAALLYLSLPELRHFSTRLTRAGPLLGRLARRPTLTGLTGLLKTAIEHHGLHRLKDRLLPPVLHALARAFARFRRHRPVRLDWTRILMPTSFARRARVLRTIVTVRPRAQPQKLRPYHAALERLRRVLPELGIDPAHGIRVGWTGGAVLADEQLVTVRQGLGAALAVSFLIILVLVALAVRSVRMTAAILLTLVVGLAWTTALATLALGPFNLISVAFSVLFVGLGVDFGVQYGVRYLEEYHAQSDTPRALTRTARGLTWPLVLAASAAAISFYSFLPTDYTGIIDLGVVAGTSMFIAVFAYITLMPVWIRLFGRAHRFPPSGHRLAARYASLIHTGARPVLVMAVLLAIAAVPLSLRTHFDFNPLHLMNPQAPAVRTLDRLAAQSRYSPYSIDLLVRGRRRARLMTDRLARLSSVGRVVSLRTLIPQNQRRKQALLRRLRLILPPFTLRPDRKRYLSLPVDAGARLKRDAAVFKDLTKASVRSPRLRFALRRFASSLSRLLHDRAPTALSRLQHTLLGGLVSNLDFLSHALRPPRVTTATLPHTVVRLFRAPGRIYRLEIFSRLDLTHQTALRRFVRQVRRLAPDAVGTPVMLVAGGETVLNAFVEASLIALVLTAALLYLVLRRWRDVGLILGTTVITVVLTTASMAVLHQSYNLANIIVLPLLLGLSLAYGIYFILRWRDGIPVENVLRSSTPRGVLYSGATTLGTFGSLMLAADPGVGSLGRALVIALAWVLVSTLVVLPSLLTLVAHAPGKMRVQSRDA